MSYQSINNNPFQQSQSPNIEDSENDEDANHNIKFTIPPNSNDKGEDRRAIFFLISRLFIFGRFFVFSFDRFSPMESHC